MAGRSPCQASQPIHPAAAARARIQTPSSAFMVRDMARTWAGAGGSTSRTAGRTTGVDEHRPGQAGASRRLRSPPAHRAAAQGRTGRALCQPPDRGGRPAGRGDSGRGCRPADGRPAARHARGHRRHLRGFGTTLRPGGRQPRGRGDGRQVAAQGGAQAPADRQDAGQVAAREAAEARRQDLQPARPDAKPAGGMDTGAPARLCRVGRGGGAVMPRAQSDAGGRLRRGPRRGEPALRPSGRISTVDKQGRVNLAPYSFYNGVSESPPMVYFAITGTYGDTPTKHSRMNAESTGEFVVNMVSENLKEQMNVTTSMVAFGVDELRLAGLTPAPCTLVTPPRVKESPVALECRYWRTIELPAEKGNEAKRGSVVFGQVVGVHINDGIIKDGRIDTLAFRPVARPGYSEYTTTDNVWCMRRPIGPRYQNRPHL